MTEQEHTTVPFRYRASLSWDERVPTRPEPPGRKRQFGDPEHRSHALAAHSMHLAGPLHPKPYDMQTALALATEKLEYLLALGWKLDSLIVNGYDKKDA